MKPCEMNSSFSRSQLWVFLLLLKGHTYSMCSNITAALWNGSFNYPYYSNYIHLHFQKNDFISLTWMAMVVYFAQCMYSNYRKKEKRLAFRTVFTAQNEIRTVLSPVKCVKVYNFLLHAYGPQFHIEKQMSALNVHSCNLFNSVQSVRSKDEAWDQFYPIT